jgi:hypothetical protein
MSDFGVLARYWVKVIGEEFSEVRFARTWRSSPRHYFGAKRYRARRGGALSRTVISTPDTSVGMSADTAD